MNLEYLTNAVLKMQKSCLNDIYYGVLQAKMPIT